MSKLGYDLFIEEANSSRKHTCNVCGAATEVNVAVDVARNFVNALRKSLEICDLHKCPHSEKQWHVTALKLIEEIEKTPSKSIAEIMRKDLLEILSENGKND
ncbi:MAG: hypothetical protein H6540_09700 [Bacteroidales bacterium]|nr:hypothetical protein [Bacteroidales bacterium]